MNNTSAYLTNVRKLEHPRRQIFRDSTLDDLFYELGYVVLPLFDESLLSSLSEVHKASKPEISSGFYASTYSKNIEYRLTSDLAIREKCSRAVLAQVIDYQVLAGNFLIKEPGADSELPLHQDWTMVDETEFCTINVWFPLMPLASDSGHLFVFPGSQDFSLGLRGNPSYKTPVTKLNSVIRDNFLQKLDVPLGSVVYMNSALLHYSPANLSNETRIAACLNISPKEAALFHYFFDHEHDRVEQYHVSPGFFLYATLGERPKDFPIINTIEKYHPPTFTLSDLQVALGISVIPPTKVPENTLKDDTKWWKRIFKN